MIQVHLAGESLSEEGSGLKATKALDISPGYSIGG